jgi:hypothetical protein
MDYADRQVIVTGNRRAWIRGGGWTRGRGRPFGSRDDLLFGPTKRGESMCR